MRSAVRPAPVGADEALLIGLTGLVMVAGLTVGGDSGLAYLVVALPVVLGISWWRPVYGFAMLLGLVLLTEEFEIRTLAGGIEPWLLQSLPIFRNLQDYTPLGGVYANAVEAWIGLLVGIWAVKGLLAGRLRVAPIPCTAAWLAALVTIGMAFVLGVTSGGDIKPALWEVRALGYLLGLAWLVPQIVERRQDIVLLVAVITLSFGAKAVQGLYRYVVELGLQLDLRETFMAHEDPVMFVPLFFLLFLPPGPDGTRSASTIVSEQFAMPAAIQWKGVADLITNGLSQLPPSAVISMIVAAILAIVFEVARIRTRGAFPLSAVSIGLGVVLPPESCFAMWVGAMIFWWQGRKKPAPGTREHAIWVEGYESICAGLISGAALVGIGNAIVNVLLGA